jgi:hypothetical protein
LDDVSCLVDLRTGDENPLLRGVGLLLWRLWRREPIDFGRLDAGILAAAVVASVAAVSAYGLIWPSSLTRARHADSVLVDHAPLQEPAR